MTEYPKILTDFARYKTTIQGRSVKTSDQYCLDLMLFFKFLIASRSSLPLEGEEFENISITSVDLDFVNSVTEDEVLEFFYFTTSSRDNHARARARKLSAIKGFYKYLIVRNLSDKNPVLNIETPKTSKELPKFLSLEEALKLLDTIEGDKESKTRERDYAIATLFLNCGMRLSELCGISLGDIDPELRSMRVIGKGSKERIIYLNDACKEALLSWFKVREHFNSKKTNALFLSSRGDRISNKTVQWMIYKYLDMAGFKNRKFSVHKLRHTAATLMYQEGGVDVRVLKEILGHEQLNTTQIYTHVSNSGMENAMKKNPLSSKSKKDQ